MDTQTTQTGTDTAHSQNSEAGGSDNVSSDQRRQQFIEAARARRDAAAKPAKEQTAPAKEPDATPEAPAGETNPEATPTDQAKETQPDNADSAPESEESVLSQFKLDPKAQYGINKALRRYADKTKHAIAERDALKKEAETLKSQLAQVQQQATQQKPAEQAAPVRPPTLDPSDPAANANSEEDLVKLQTEAKDTLLLYDRARRDIDRAVDAGEEKVVIAGKEYEVSVLESARELAIKVIGESIPKRQKYLQEKTQFDQYAKSINPDAFDSSKQDAIEVRGFLQANPEILASSKANLIAALVIKGKRALEAEQKAATEKSAVKKAPEQKPPDLGESSAAVSKTTERSSGTSHLDKEIREMQRRYSESGSMEDRTKLERLKTARRKAAQ